MRKFTPKQWEKIWTLGGLAALVLVGGGLGLFSLFGSSCRGGSIGEGTSYTDCLRNGRAYLDEVDITPEAERPHVIQEKCSVNTKHWPSR